MASGSLAIITPSLAGKNEVLYTAPAGKLVEGRIYITNQTSSEIKFRVGLSTGTASDFDVTRGYVVFDRMLAPNEYFESDTVYFADGESAIVRADHTSVTFTLLGTETEDRENAGFLAQGFSEMNGKKSTLLFTVPTDYKQFRGNLFVCNRGSFDTKVRVGLGTTATDYLEYNYIVERGSTHSRVDLRASGGDVIYIRSSEEMVNFVLSGYYENFTTFSGDVGIAATMQSQDAYVKGAVSIGVTSPAGNALKVIGSTELTDVNVTDDLTVQGNANVAGVATFVGTVTFQGGTVNTGVGTENAVVLDANVNSNVTPGTSNTFDLGQDSKKWRYVYSGDTIRGNQIDLSNGTSGIATIGRVGTGLTQTQAIIGAATTAVMATGNIAANGDLIVKGQVGVGTVAQPQLRGNTSTGDLEVYNVSLTRWVPVLGVDNTYVTATNNTTLTEPFCTVLADMSGGAWTLTLPSSPAQGDKIRIIDYKKSADSNNLTVNRNGSNIMGDSADLTVGTQGASFELLYTDASSGWVIFSI